MINISCISDYSGELEKKPVVVRAELNAPLDKGGGVANDFRIQKLLPTLDFLIERGAVVILLAHIGRDKDATLEPIMEHLSGLGYEVNFYKNFFHSWGTEEFMVNDSTLKDDLNKYPAGSLVVLDNIRQTEAEKENSVDLAVKIAEYADFYVNEAFPVAHRVHCSVNSLPKQFSRETRFTGITFHKEHQSLEKALKPQSPSIFITGGAKFKTKLPLIQSMLPLYDHVFVGGALANNFFKLAGYEVGQSLLEELSQDQSEQLQEVLQNEKFILPQYVSCKTVTGETIDKNISEVTGTDIIYDISPQSVEGISLTIKGAQAIIWNGPLGYYEGGFDAGTKAMAVAIASSDGYSVAGGGDTIDAVYEVGLQDNFSFLSSAGGAMIDYLADGDLPAINVLEG